MPATILLAADDVSRHVRRLGAEIEADHPDGVVLVGVLKGALLFVARKLTGRDWLPDPLVESGELAPQSGLFGTTFPFGPALAIGAAIGVLFAPQLLG